MLTGDKIKKIVTSANKSGDLFDLIQDLRKGGKLTYLHGLLTETPMTLKTAKLIDIEIKKVAKDKNLAHPYAAKALGIHVTTYMKIMHILERKSLSGTLCKLIGVEDHKLVECQLPIPNRHSPSFLCILQG